MVDVRAALTSKTAITVYIALAVTACLAAGFYLGRVYAGIPTLLLILYALSVLAGFAFMPLFAWTIGPSLGSFIPERLANMVFIVSMVGVRRGILEQQETDEYELKRGDADLEPRSYWSRWALAPFGITFEATRQAFGSLVVEGKRLEKLRNLEYGNPGTATVDLNRGNRAWFVTKDDIAPGSILVPIGQKLAQLRNAAGPALGIEAYAAALGEHGGDTSGSTNRLRLIGTFVFVVLGAGVGYIVHF